MKQFKDEQGYALLVVLLMVVLFLGLSAVFMAGSMSNAKQETTVDTSNLAVAAAEMGVLYHTTSFEKELVEVNKAVASKSKEMLDNFKSCVRSEKRIGCNTAIERDLMEDDINEALKAYYLEQIEIKAIRYRENHLHKKELFSGIAYLLEDVKVKGITDPNIIQIELMIQGIKEDVIKDLRTTLKVGVPENFIVKSDIQHEPIIIEQVNNAVKYEDIFKVQKPQLSCKNLMSLINTSTSTTSGACYAELDESMRNFSDFIISKGLNPKDFTVYTEDFITNFCKEKNNDNHCRDIDLKKLNIITPSTSIAVNNHMRYFSNFILTVNGKLETGNHFEMVGLVGGRQTIILKEMHVGNHLNEIENTNLLILGNASGSDAELYIKGKVEIGQNSNFCLDIDRINQKQWKAIAEKVVFLGNGSLSYYTKDPNKRFPLQGEHIFRAPSYESFLESCGVVMSTTESVNVPVPVMLDTDFDFIVNY
ncbi:hypothetical protein [Planococcus beigongshangi]|uniref:hypothetical protein n=1 Tax=Planococcus beigongshangi TaxID=2782536 RepID=UPI00193C44FD|nr:hypothetical protein [Planococcus beigongshangi]